MKKILVCGSREWENKRLIKQVLFACQEKYGDFSCIEGHCRGADQIAGTTSLDMEMVVVKVPARWSRYGNSAGMKRNKYMLDKCKPDIVLAFHADLQASKGTKGMIEIAKKAGLPTGDESPPFVLPE
jgi:hypothetical protein